MLQSRRLAARKLHPNTTATKNPKRTLSLDLGLSLDRTKSARSRAKVERRTARVASAGVLVKYVEKT